MLVSVDVNSTSNATSAFTLTPEILNSFLLFDESEELEKISNGCFKGDDYTNLTGGIAKEDLAKLLAAHAIPESIATIGMAELRATLKFGPVRPWKKFNATDPSKEELEAAATLEDYYNLREPRSINRSLNSPNLFESNLTPTIAYFDKQMIQIRVIFRRRLEKVRRLFKVLDRKKIDRLITEFNQINRKINKAMNERKSKYCYSD